MNEGPAEGRSALILQHFPEPIGVVDTVPEQSVDIRQASEKCPHPDVIADLTGREKEFDWAAFDVVDGI